MNSTLRKTRKDFATRNSLRQSHNYRATLSASPVCKNRRCDEENSSESNDDMVPGMEDLDENAQEYLEDCSDGAQELLENEMAYDSQNETVPTANTYDETEDPNYSSENTEDLKKLGLKDLIYKLFLNIYNSEKDNIMKLKNEIFPRITEDTQLDNFITYAISNCMEHVKDELQSYIKKNLKAQRKLKDAPQKSMINDSTFVPFASNIQKYNEIIDKIIDFYELFKCSIAQIVEVWKEKLGHIERLYDIFEFRHKKLFGVNIWQDKEIISVMRLYFNQSYDDKEYMNRVKELKNIDDDLNDNNQYNAKDVGPKGGKKNKKNKNKNKPKKKKSKDNVTSGKNEKEDEKLYEINDIDLLCSIIQNSNDNKKGKVAQQRK